MSAGSAILARCAAGEISPQVALAQLVLCGEAPSRAALAELAAAASPDSPVARLASLARLHEDRLAQLDRLARQGVDPMGVEATAAFFDRLAREAPEAAVAFYSLGDPGLLDAATRELASLVSEWTTLKGRTVLDFGCGIGRLAIAVAPEAGEVIGVDLAEGMVAEARRRAGHLANLRFERVDGRDLGLFADSSIDVMLAVDSFPYLHRAGSGVLEGCVAEAARILRPSGDLLVFNWSYRGDTALDIGEARELAAGYGFAVLRAGERPFAIWDGIGFHLRREP